MAQVIKGVVDNEDITQRIINGTGTLDALFETVLKNFDDQVVKRAWDKTDSANLFATVVETCVAQAVQFALQKDTASLNNAILENKVKVSKEEVTHAKQTTELNKLAIKEGEQRLILNEIDMELRKQELQFRYEELQMKRERHQIEMQIAMADLKLREREMDLKIRQYEIQYRISEMEIVFKEKEIVFKERELDAQLEIARMNKELIAQKVITEKAQTQDKDESGKPYTGIVGAQIDLYRQQVASFIQDAKYKISKMYGDVFVASKSVDEGTPLPESLDKRATNKVITEAVKGAGLPSPI